MKLTVNGGGGDRMNITGRSYEFYRDTNKIIRPPPPTIFRRSIITSLLGHLPVVYKNCRSAEHSNERS